ncbi:hypothetical protein DCAR_0624656 [Daucus carota subsp. sativus]|uniref:Uncharacterized protein n=1 Tax=Daucus carota subsp. sativus TaxID=79200 RepID=A0AAF1B5Z9_DAUCS|nr:PREDICTED: plant intracellular Ras-group-related LRR protein 9-like [Daucus carota subsp. sativus]WOH05242.1 hypothetical protein DCAR_0624656 [Daucus carota subsp. sativus]
MDPSPRSLPILSYVMKKFPSFKRPAPSDFDVEQPLPMSPSSLPSGPYFELKERMPHLTNPKLISQMRSAVADVSQTRSILKKLGPRPDHEAVDIAKARLAEIENELEEVELAEANADNLKKKEAEREKQMYKTVISLDEMHESYGKLLTDAETRLEKIYEAAAAGYNGEDDVAVVEEVNEEVVRILQEANQREVQRIDLAKKHLRFLPEAFGKIRPLVVLDLSSNQFQMIPDSIAGLENLEDLNLSSNILTSLPESIGLLLKLKTLDVSNNKLVALPDSICHCKSLVELNASFNKLAYLPTKIGFELVSLRRLSIQLNKIRSLPTSIGEMSSLIFLDVHFNELQGLPRSIGNLTHLEFLNLSSNFSDLTELPDTFGELTNLQELDLSNNQIRELPLTFRHLNNLRKFNIEENPLVIPPKETVKNGVEAVRAYLTQRYHQLLLEEEEKERKRIEAQDESPKGWFTRSTSWLKDSVTTVSGNVSEIMGVEGTRNQDPLLNQQL